ncbi:MAG: riboflavin kinase [Patescibacteria group bacterium]
MFIIGKVKSDNKRGRQLGFATANLNLHKNIASGVYASVVKVNNKKYSSVTFIGRPESFFDNNKRVETHIFNFSRNIYNQYISVKLLKKIRSAKKFNNKQAFTQQINKDIKIVKKCFPEL